MLDFGVCRDSLLCKTGDLTASEHWIGTGQRVEALLYERAMALGPLTARTREQATASWSGVRASPFDVPPQGARLARFFFGFHLIFALTALLLRNAEVRGRYVRVLAAQIAATLALSVVIAWIAPSIVELAMPSFASSWMKGEARRHGKSNSVQVMQDGKWVDVEQDDVKASVDAEDDDADDDDDSPRVKARTLEAKAKAATAKAKLAVAAAAAASSAHGRDHEVDINGMHLRVHEDDDGSDDGKGGHGDDAPMTPLRRALVSVVRAYASIVLAQWVVVALSRDYHDALGDRAASESGLPPLDEPPPRPRVRVSFKWMKKRARERIRGLFAFGAGLPLIALALVPLTLSAVASGHLLGQVLRTTCDVFQGLLTFVWGAYWLTVVVCSKSPHAFHSPGDPWFLRGYDHLTAHAFGFRWALPRLYGRIGRRLTAALASPALCAERAPFESAGLALAHVLFGLPFFRLASRIVVPVAASHIVRRAQRTELHAPLESSRDD